MNTERQAVMHGGVWECYGAECRAPLAKYAGRGDNGGRRVEIRTELVRLPSRDNVPTYGRTRRGAKDHRSRDWSGSPIEYRGFAVLPIRVHCLRCKRTQLLRDLLNSIATNSEVL